MTDSPDRTADLEWLLTAGWLPEMRRFSAGRDDVEFWVGLRRAGERSVSVQFSGASLGEAIGKAREGITP
jgi:hypothetical protein